MMKREWGTEVTERRTAIGTLPTGDDWLRVVRWLNLSSRQAEVVRALLCNLTVAETAETLGIRPDTVKTYLKRTYQRLEVKSRVELAIRVMAAAQIEAATPSGDTRAGGLRAGTALR